MKQFREFISEKLQINSNSKVNKNKLNIDDFEASDEKISEEIRDLEDSLFDWVDRNTSWNSEDSVIEYLQDEDGLIEWAEEEGVDNDILGSMIHGYEPDIITYWVHKWFVENSE